MDIAKHSHESWAALVAMGPKVCRDLARAAAKDGKMRYYERYKYVANRLGRGGRTDVPSN